MSTFQGGFNLHRDQNLFVCQSGEVASGPADPYWAFVSLLVNPSGSNGSTNLIDQGPLALPITNVNNGTQNSIVTANPPSSGNPSVQMNGGLGGTTVPIGVAGGPFDISASDATVETYFYVPTSLYGHQVQLLNAAGTGANSSVNAGFGLQLYDDGAGGGGYTWKANGSGLLGVAGKSNVYGNWHHLAVVQTVAGGALYIYLDGNLIDNGGGAPSPNFQSTVPFSITGGYSGAQYFVGQFAGLRITKANRYPGGISFTPPTLPLPTHG